MAKGPRIPEDLKLAIGALALESDQGLRAKEIRARMKEGLRERGDTRRIPGISAIQKKMKEARDGTSRLAIRQKDRPWSLGTWSSGEHKPSPEALPDLLQIWSECLVRGLPFTVRQAIWAYRLRNFAIRDVQSNPPSLDDPMWLYEWAKEYAARDQVAEAFGLTLDTADLDGRLAFLTPWRGDDTALLGAQWAYCTASNTGAIKEVSVFTAEAASERHRVLYRVALALGARIAEETEEGLRDLYDRAIGGMATYGGNSAGGVVITQVSGTDFLEQLQLHLLPEITNKVFALWMRRIGETATWRELPPAKKKTVAAKLVEAVREHTKAAPQAGSWLDRWRWSNWQPMELLRELGLESLMGKREWPPVPIEVRLRARKQRAPFLL